MSRGLSSPNLAHAQGDNVSPVWLVAFAFDTPVYVHSGLGTIPYGGNNYIGVGSLGDISGMEESEDLAPVSVQFMLSGIDQTFLAEALNAGNYRDVITVYKGYRTENGELEDDPERIGRFYYEHATIRKGAENVIVITAQHELDQLGDKPGGKFTDEEQRRRYPGDVGYEYVPDVGTKNLIWAGRNAQRGRTGPAPRRGPRFRDR